MTRKNSWHLMFVAALTIILVILFYIVGLLHFKSTEWPEFGNFVGGAAGVILTALTFLALLYTIHIQSNELSLSREELRLTRGEMAQNRDELARSAESLAKQVDGLSRQSFERRLFDSLQLLSDLVNQFEYKAPLGDQPDKGGQSFSAMYHLFKYLGPSESAKFATEDGDELGENEFLIRKFKSLRPFLAPYFRTLYNIYRFLDESPYVNDKFYNRIIRSQIPDHALALLFYNSLTERGRNFQKYIIKYDILDNIPADLFFDPRHRNILLSFPTPKASEFSGSTDLTDSLK